MQNKEYMIPISVIENKLEKYKGIRKYHVDNYKQNTFSGIKVSSKIEVLKEILKENKPNTIKNIDIIRTMDASELSKFILDEAPIIARSYTESRLGLENYLNSNYINEGDGINIMNNIDQLIDSLERVLPRFKDKQYDTFDIRVDSMIEDTLRIVKEYKTNHEELASKYIGVIDKCKEVKETYSNTPVSIHLKDLPRYKENINVPSSTTIDLLDYIIDDSII